LSATHTNYYNKAPRVMMMNQAESEFRTMSIRLPHDIKTWLEAEAARNDRSQGSEVIRTLRARMRAEQTTKATSKRAAG
jgi:hypothetical protein